MENFQENPSCEVDHDAGPARVSATELLERKASAIHGWGLFAALEFRSGLRLIEYRGERIDKETSTERRRGGLNHSIFFLDDECDLDGNVEWNPARFINHSCAPNAEVICDEGRLWVISKRPIGAGEEITFDYGYDLEDYEDFPCQCGAASCVGYIVAQEFHADLARAIGRKLACKRRRAPAEKMSG